MATTRKIKVISVCNPKGGASKSTLAILLAERISRESKKTAIIDMNGDQATLSKWWVYRGQPANPYLLRSSSLLDEDIAVLDADGWDYVVIDGPANNMTAIEMQAMLSDIVLIPTLASKADVSSVDQTIDVCRRRRRPYAIVIGGWDNGREWKTENEKFMKRLAGRTPILQQKVSSHPKYRGGYEDGKSGAEGNAALAKEGDAIWQEVKSLMGVTTKGKGAHNV